MYQHLSEPIEIKKLSEKDNVGKFAIENLYPGYGLTVGNSLRRVLLSSLPGAAITQVKIKGVDHEFSSLPGMIEDIVEFSLNLKRVRFKILTDEPQNLTLKIKGDKKITARNIKTTIFVETINPEIYLATLTKKGAELDMEIVVEKGLGYVPAEDRKTERLPIGTIVLDAIFSPVTRVDFDIENMRFGEKINYNRIKLEIETDGSINPTEALHKATSIIKDHFQKIYDAEDVQPPEKKETKTKKK